MLTAEKANKVLTINEADAETLRVQGFDIVETDEKGNRIIKAHGVGKTVSYEQYEKLEKELVALKTKKEDK